jgi:hypothetical protein
MNWKQSSLEIFTDFHDAADSGRLLSERPLLSDSACFDGNQACDFAADL